VDAISRDDVAARAGVDPDHVDALVRLGILTPGADGSFTPGAARATRVVRDLERAGLPLDGIAEAIQGGFLSFDLFDLGNYDRIASLTADTFRRAAERTGIPLNLLLVVREAIGFAVAGPDDRMREDESEVIPLIQSGLAGGLPPASIERILRVYGESLRRMVETESEAWMTQLVRPLIASGMPAQEVFEMASKFGEMSMGLIDQAVLAIHRGQQDHVWMIGTYEWVEDALERAGLRSKVTRPPAMCFFDLSGYTRLTEERGDKAAAEMALTLSRLVQRTAHEHRGRVVKWLGDGVMLYFDEPADALVGAVEMAERVPAAGLPQAHVGVDAGPVIVQDGDYFGSTVNVAARIAAHARAGEVLASDRAVQTAGDLPAGIRVTDIGPVELKGVSRPVPLRRIERAP
jgi:adenylate cyclase